MLMVQQAIVNAAREGARSGAIQLDGAQALATAQATATDYLTRSGMDMTRTSVNPIFTSISGTQAVDVTVSYSYPSMLVAWLPGVGSTIPLRSRVVMRQEA